TDRSPDLFLHLNLSYTNDLFSGLCLSKILNIFTSKPKVESSIFVPEIRKTKRHGLFNEDGRSYNHAHPVY
ncbi:MAG: hypothetical protein JXN62_10250, partial [Bacteroidales bacterium]|nr:hypothetical protein [Bacteroidales bacterium]